MLCRVCNCSEASKTFLVKEMFLGLRHSFPYAECKSCRSLSIQATPELEAYYSQYPSLETNAFKPHWITTAARWMAVKSSGFLGRASLKLLTTFYDLPFASLHGCGLDKSSRVLDVGCGTGEFTCALTAMGLCQAHGIDPSLNPTRVEESRGTLNRVGIDAVGGTYDLIMFHHSFEHVNNPKEVASKVDSLLAPGGTLLIRMPNVESYSYRTFQACWEGIHAPYHLFLPSARGFQHIFQHTSLGVAKVRYEQLLTSFLNSVNYGRDIAALAPLGLFKFCMDQQSASIRSKCPPGFSIEEILNWKKLVPKVIARADADYVAFYLRKQK